MIGRADSHESRLREQRLNVFDQAKRIDRGRECSQRLRVARPIPEQQASARAQHALDLLEIRDRVPPEVEHVHRESGIESSVRIGQSAALAAHGNVTGAGALDVTRLGEARALMMNQTSLDGLLMNLSPRFFLVLPTSLTTAEQLTATLAPTVSMEVNPSSNRLIALGDANLTGRRFYVLADPARLPQYVYGFLAGGGALRVDTRAGWEVEGLEMRVVTEFGCGAIESRAGVTGAGS